MYAIASVSSSAFQIARVTNEVEKKARESAPPQLTSSNYNQQATSIAGSANVQAPAHNTSSFAIAAKASQTAAIHKISNSNASSRQNFSRPQQDLLNQFNLEMINQSPQNATSSTQKTPNNQNKNIAAAQRPAQAAEILTESPYLIVVLNQNLVNAQKAETNKTNEKPPPTRSIKI